VGIPLGITAATYRLLADGLSAVGIATIRTDKRGQFASRAAAADPDNVRLADYAADVRAWVAEARSRSGLPCAFAVGHSEGALVAMLAASTPRPAQSALIRELTHVSLLHDERHANPRLAHAVVQHRHYR